MKRAPAQCGYDGAFEEGEREIINPDAPLSSDDDLAKTKTIVVKANLRETPIEHMFSRGEIDERLKRAADLFRALTECFPASKGVVDLNGARVVLDGTSFGLPHRTLDSGKHLKAIRDLVGAKDYKLLWWSVTVGLSLDKIAQKLYPGYLAGTKLAVELGKHVSRRIKDALDDVAKHFDVPFANSKRQEPERRTRFYRAFGKDEVQW